MYIVGPERKWWLGLFPNCVQARHSVYCLFSLCPSTVPTVHLPTRLLQGHMIEVLKTQLLEVFTLQNVSLATITGDAPVVKVAESEDGHKLERK